MSIINKKKRRAVYTKKEVIVMRFTKSFGYSILLILGFCFCQVTFAQYITLPKSPMQLSYNGNYKSVHRGSWKSNKHPQQYNYQRFKRYDRDRWEGWDRRNNWDRQIERNYERGGWQEPQWRRYQHDNWQDQQRNREVDRGYGQFDFYRPN